MPNRYHQQTGEQVLANLRSHLVTTGQTLRGHVGRLELPDSYRRDVRRKAVDDAQAAVDEARQAFGAWTQAEIQRARATLAADSVGSAADETAKLRREQTIQRLIQTAQLSDQRTGPQMRAGRLVPNPAAWALADEANRLYLETPDYHGALAHAEAAVALGAGQAAGIRDAAQRQIWMDDPEKASALKSLETVQRAQVIFQRESNAALVSALQAAAEEALDMGDDGNVYRKAAVGPSLAAKVAAIAASAGSGEAYQHPEGALASEPAGQVRPSGEETSLVERHR